VDKNESSEALLIVYYGGHAMINDARQSAWMWWAIVKSISHAVLVSLSENDRKIRKWSKGYFQVWPIWWWYFSTFTFLDRKLILNTFVNWIPKWMEEY
jgi:hypothetical protein